MKVQYVFVVLLCLGISNKLFAMTASELVDYCKVAKSDSQDVSEMIRAAHCYGYVLGAVDGWTMMQDVVDKDGHAQAKKFLCIPKGVDDHELALVYLKYMDGNPQQLHWNARETFMERNDKGLSLS